MRLLEQKKISGKLGPIHFIGIGGIGMSGIASIMHSLGYNVQGSDLSTNNNTQRLQETGVKVFNYHDPVNIENVKYVVISSAVKENNVELQAALQIGIPVIPRAEMLAEIMRFKTCIAISGSHGKTTTTSMIAHIFEAAGIHPTVINGGIINNKDTNAYTGSSDYMITEADESDATFIRIPATIGVITNIDSEHLDFYGSFDKLLEAFKTFVYNIPFYGFAVVCVDQPILRDMISNIKMKQIVTYGIENQDAHVRAFNIHMDGFSSTFDVKISCPLSESGSIVIEKIKLPVPGLHNVLNSLAAIAIAMEMEFGARIIQTAFKSFNGVKRRFTKVGEYNGNIILDDYAHHPEEIKATIKAARNLADITDSKLIAICQPHRYSRVVNLFPEFQTCFELADSVYISEIYGAGEDNLTNIDHVQVAQNIKHPKVYALNSFEELPQIIHKSVGKNIILMMGAGSITTHAHQLEQNLRNLDK
jgi:UDP-N-acetylmuramate--alanine ligase